MWNDWQAGPGSALVCGEERQKPQVSLGNWKHVVGRSREARLIHGCDPVLTNFPIHTMRSEGYILTSTPQ